MSRPLGVSSAVIVLSALGTISHAATGGRTVDIPTTPIYTLQHTIPANVGVTIETMNLSPYSDTVLHVQNYPSGSFLAGNDDVGTSPRSRLTIGAVSYSREVWVIVRAFSQYYTGTCTLRFTPTSGSVQDYPVTFGGYMFVAPANLVSGTHVLTVEQQAGTNDTVLLVVSNTDANAIAFDDEDGVGSMSWLHMSTACGSWCYFMIGRFQSSSTGSTTIIWDEDFHYNNPDSDGLGNALEYAIGTNISNKDSDADALDDDAEVIGIDGTTPVKLSYYGANPLTKDAFFEVDWYDCDIPSQNCSYNGAPEDRDAWQMTGPEAEAFVAGYATDVRVHMDIGRTNTNASTRTQWGNWGGAARVPIGPAQDFLADCETLTSARSGIFHHLESTPSGSGGKSTQPGACAAVESHHLGKNLHETGHNFNLYHGATLASVPMNFKPHYKSPMNYAFQDDPAVTRFSRRDYGTLPLVPSALNESVGLNTLDPAKLAHLLTNPYFLCVDSTTGGVDWNRDGLINGSGVISRGGPTYGYHWYGMEFGQTHADIFAATNVWRDPILARLGALGRVYLFVRQETTGQIGYYSTNTLGDCNHADLGDGCGSWSPSILGPPTTLPAETNGYYAAAAEPLSGTILMLAYIDLNYRLKYKTLDVAQGEQWSGASFIDANTQVSGDLAMVKEPSGALKLYGMDPFTKNVLRWTYANGAWSGPQTQLWSNGTTVTAEYGLALTPGFQSDISGQQTYAIVPVPSPVGQLEFARVDQATGRFVSFGAAAWPVAREATNARPGIRYVPFSTSVPEVGRFYLYWRQKHGGAENFSLMTAMTQGNIVNPSTGSCGTVRALQWLGHAFVNNQDFRSAFGVSLLSDIGIDAGVRLAFHESSTDRVYFLPFADGIMNASLTDNDDFNTIRSSLRCALLSEPCP